MHHQPVSRGSSAHHDRHRPAGSTSALSAAIAPQIAAAAGPAPRSTGSPTSSSPRSPCRWPTPISDAKVLTGRQKPMTEVAFLFAEIHTQRRPHRDRLQLLQAGRRPGAVRPRQGDRAGPDRRGSQRHRQALDQARAGPAPRSAAAAWPPRRSPPSTSRCGTSRPSAPACRWPSCSARTATRCRATTPPADSCTRRSTRCWRTRGRSLDSGIGGIKIKVGQPDWRLTSPAWSAVREHLGDDVPLMVDANQQWDRPTAQRMGRIFEQFNLVWIEEPLDAYDAEGHAQLARSLDTPIATGEMLASVGRARAADRGRRRRHHPARRAPHRRHHPVPQAGRARRAAGICSSAPHFAMEIHLHLGGGLPARALGRALRLARPLFNERLEIRTAACRCPTGPGSASP